jgi:cytochrome c553
MKKTYKSGLVVSAIAAAALLATASAQAFTHDGVALLDATGAAVTVDGTNTGQAYSSKATCGACHDYDAIERHSYHAQLGANQHMGFNAFAFGNWNSVAPKGKTWVMSPGHAGKW